MDSQDTTQTSSTTTQSTASAQGVRVTSQKRKRIRRPETEPKCQRCSEHDYTCRPSHGKRSCQLCDYNGIICSRCPSDFTAELTELQEKAKSKRKSTRKGERGYYACDACYLSSNNNKCEKKPTYGPASERDKCTECIKNRTKCSFVLPRKKRGYHARDENGESVREMPRTGADNPTSFEQTFDNLEDLPTSFEYPQTIGASSDRTSQDLEPIIPFADTLIEYQDTAFGETSTDLDMNMDNHAMQGWWNGSSVVL